MDKREVLKNMAEALKLMTPEEITSVAAFSEGMAFMARQRQSQQTEKQ